MNSFDFYKAQDEARRKSRIIVLVFLLSILIMAIASNLFLFIGFKLFANRVSNFLMPDIPVYAYAFNAILTLFVIFILFAYSRGEKNKKNGDFVAKLLNCNYLDRKNANHRQLIFLNVVDEIAIASGIPAPRVYLMNEESINSFCVGLSDKDAVIGITDGSIKNLTRDQMQAIAAFEFGRILNGDIEMNSNINSIFDSMVLIGKSKILIKYLIFPFLLFVNFNLFYFKNKFTLIINSVLIIITFSAYSLIILDSFFPIIILILGLEFSFAFDFIKSFLFSYVAIGYLGYFLSDTAKSYFNRQRVFLSDAVSVELTRNVDGLLSLLENIGKNVKQINVIKNRSSRDFGNMFFVAFKFKYDNFVLTSISNFFRRVNAYSANNPIYDKNGNIINNSNFYPNDFYRLFDFLNTHPKLNDRINKIKSIYDHKIKNDIDEINEKMSSHDLDFDLINSIINDFSSADELNLEIMAPSFILSCFIKNKYYEYSISSISDGLGFSISELAKDFFEKTLSMSPVNKLVLIENIIPFFKNQTNDKISSFIDAVNLLIGIDGGKDLNELLLISWIDYKLRLSIGNNNKKIESEVSYNSDDFYKVELASLSLLVLLSFRNSDFIIQRKSWDYGLASLGLPESTPVPSVNLTHLKFLLPDLINSSLVTRKNIFKMIQASIMAEKRITGEWFLSDVLALILELTKPSLIEKKNA